MEVLSRLAFYTCSFFSFIVIIARNKEAHIVNSSLFSCPIQSNTSTGKITNIEILKMYFISCGGFLTMKTDVVIASKFSNLDGFVEYSLLSRFAIAIIAIISLYVLINFPRLSALVHSGQVNEFIKRNRKMQLVVAVGTLTCATLIILAYPWVINIALGRAPVLSSQLVVFMMLFAILCGNIIPVGQAIIATGDSLLAMISLPTAIVGFFVQC